MSRATCLDRPCTVAMDTAAPGMFHLGRGEKQAPEPRLNDPPVQFHIFHGSSREGFIETAELEKQLTPDGKVARPEIPTCFIDGALLVEAGATI